VQVVIKHGGDLDPALLDTICTALKKAGLHERAGDVYEYLGRWSEAMQSFRRGHAFRKAVDLSRWVASSAFPTCCPPTSWPWHLHAVKHPVPWQRPAAQVQGLAYGMGSLIASVLSHVLVVTVATFHIKRGQRHAQLLPVCSCWPHTELLGITTAQVPRATLHQLGTAAEAVVSYIIDAVLDECFPARQTLWRVPGAAVCVGSTTLQIGLALNGAV
jgi:hypothetical protein